MNNNKLMIIDGNNIMYRAFYGIKSTNLLSTSDGLYTNAVYGFLNIMIKFMEEEKPGFVCVAFDVKGTTFRHNEFKEYKANRKGMPEELFVQIPIIKEVLDAMNVERIEQQGYEADDIIGSISFCAEKEGFDVVIVSGDKDCLQLASKTTRIKVPTTRAGKTEIREYDSDTVFEVYGVTPVQFIDVKGLMGDPSDNIPGVPGIGEKTALGLIKEFGSIENIYENIDKVEKKGVREKLINNKDMAMMSKKLATICRDMCDVWDISKISVGEFKSDKLYHLFERLEFKKLIEKLELTPDNSVMKTAKKVEIINSKDRLDSIKNQIVSKKQFSIFYLIDKLTKFDVRLSGAALCWDKDKTAYINFNQSINEEYFLEQFKGVFEDASIKKYGHDMKNLIVYLKRKGIAFRGLFFDTMLAAYIINPSRPTYTVSELSREYLGITIDSIERLAGKGRTFVHYCDMDIETISVAAATHSEMIFDLWVKLDNAIKEYKQQELYYDIELPLVEVLSDMEYRGFKVNIDYLNSFSVELKQKIDFISNEIFEIAGEMFNINSPKQLGSILFEKLNLPPLKKTKTGYSTNAEVLEQLAPRHEIVHKVLEYRQMVKLKSTYVEGLLNEVNPSTGRVHSSFNQTVTTTGRISSTEPNLQNIPIKLEMGKEIRKAFIAQHENSVLYDADYSQIELRVLAHITGDVNLIQAFKNKQDIHTTTASKIFAVPESEVTQTMRIRAKTVNFAIIYGIGEFSLSKDLGVSRKQAQKYIDDYLSQYPGVRQYMHDIVELGTRQGYVTTLFNRRRYLPELKSSNFNIRSFGKRIAMNTPIQGTAADIIKIAMIKVYNELTERKKKSVLILQVHDELIIETCNDEKDEVENILEESMVNAVKLNVPLCADAKSGKSWYQTK